MKRRLRRSNSSKFRMRDISNEIARKLYCHRENLLQTSYISHLSSLVSQHLGSSFLMLVVHEFSPLLGIDLLQYVGYPLSCWSSNKLLTQPRSPLSSTLPKLLEQAKTDLVSKRGYNCGSPCSSFRCRSSPSWGKSWRDPCQTARGRPRSSWPN